jgi:hypothetical protein
MAASGRSQCQCRLKKKCRDNVIEVDQSGLDRGSTWELKKKGQRLASQEFD